ncbi:MAG: 4-phosphoerythronate dehydrogenase [Candidatus Kapaibacterium sp.]
MKIFVEENIPNLAAALSRCGEITRFNGRELKREDLLPGCDALFIRSTTKAGRELLEGTNVKFIGTATAGTDHVDKEYLAEQRIGFSSAPGSNANSVAEYVVYAILKWARITKSELSDKKIGIIGYGNIGRLVAGYSERLGMAVYINDPPLREMGFKFPEQYLYAGKPDIFEECDIVTNHVPLNIGGPFNTSLMIDDDLIGRMKKNALFIHTSRGKVVHEEALLKRLNQQDLFAAVDVWENEPDINIPMAYKCILATPHIAGYSRDGKLKGSLKMAEAFESYFECVPDYSAIKSELMEILPLSADDFKQDRAFELLKSRRMLDNDTREFLKLTELDSDKRKKKFDLQRKNYPVRRESL